MVKVALFSVRSEPVIEDTILRCEQPPLHTDMMTMPSVIYLRSLENAIPLPLLPNISLV
jgi:hypothetical protein